MRRLLKIKISQNTSIYCQLTDPNLE